MRVSATELNKHPGALLEKATQEPVIIEKTGRASVVMISYEKYLKLTGQVSNELKAAYQQMARDKHREAQANRWSEGLIGDSGDETR